MSKPTQRHARPIQGRSKFARRNAAVRRNFSLALEPLEARRVMSATPLDVANALVHTRENYEQVAGHVYETYLKRQPDAAGLDFWATQLQQGLTDERLEASFIGSAEYIANHGGTGPAWVQGMYSDLLGRSPDTSGLAFWQQQLAAGARPEAIAHGFAASLERAANNISGIYQQYLGRSPARAEVDFWVQAYAKGTSSESIIAGFVGSPEYFHGQHGNADLWLAAACQAILNRPPSPAERTALLNEMGFQGPPPIAAPTATVSGDVLTIIGSAQDDQIVIQQVGGRLQIEGTQLSWDAATIHRIVIDGLAGNDHVRLENGTAAGQQSITAAATILGGPGNDLLGGGGGSDRIEGGDGDDNILGGAGDDTILGGAGRDKLDGLDGNDTVWGEAGVDGLRGGRGDDTLSGGDGDDIINGNAGNDRLLGDGGQDLLRGDDPQSLGGHDTLLGGDGGDWLYGESGADRLYGEEGDDTLDGGDDVDDLYGGGGDDLLLGSAGNDSLYGGDGNDYLLGASGSDALLGELGDDVLEGGEDADTLQGGNGRDILVGGAGNDFVQGDSDHDNLDGGDDDDILEGGSGDDIIRGRAGNDSLWGDSGDDVLLGLDGVDRLKGGDGDDWLDGGAGVDDLNGDWGHDDYVDPNWTVLADPEVFLMVYAAGGSAPQPPVHVQPVAPPPIYVPLTPQTEYEMVVQAALQVFEEAAIAPDIWRESWLFVSGKPNFFGGSLGAGFVPWYPS